MREGSGRSGGRAGLLAQARRAQAAGRGREERAGVERSRAWRLGRAAAAERRQAKLARTEKLAHSAHASSYTPGPRRSQPPPIFYPARFPPRSAVRVNLSRLHARAGGVPIQERLQCSQARRGGVHQDPGAGGGQRPGSASRTKCILLACLEPMPLAPQSVSGGPARSNGLPN